MANGLVPLDNSGKRKVVRKIRLDVSKRVGDECVWDENDENFRDDGCKKYIYLLVMPVQSSLVIKLDREVRRNEEAIEDLQSQLQEACGQVVSGHTCPPDSKGTREEEYDRLEAVRVGNKVVREDIYASKNLWNDYADDIHKEIIPVPQSTPPY